MRKSERKTKLTFKIRKWIAEIFWTHNQERRGIYRKQNGKRKATGRVCVNGW